jgi:ribulose bisphosphate carboxylase small subunit
MKKDVGLEVLLSLHGTEYTEENGYWYKIEAWQVESSKEIPHGIRYNLTLHNNHNKRIMGFDNAHAIKIKSRQRFKGRKITYDHQHTSVSDSGIHYEFSSADQLLTDFFKSVNEILKGKYYD